MLNQKRHLAWITRHSMPSGAEDLKTHRFLVHKKFFHITIDYFHHGENTGVSSSGNESRTKQKYN